MKFSTKESMGIHASTIIAEEVLNITAPSQPSCFPPQSRNRPMLMSIEDNGNRYNFDHGITVVLYCTDMAEVDEYVYEEHWHLHAATVLYYRLSNFNRPMFSHREIEVWGVEKLLEIEQRGFFNVEISEVGGKNDVPLAAEEIIKLESVLERERSKQNDDNM